MKNKKITRKITQGVYVLTTRGGGCIVDAVSQVSAGDMPCISVAVMKENNTCTLLDKNKTFALSVLDVNVNPDIIKTFGLHSMRDINKFETIECMSIESLNVIKDSLGYMICEIVDKIDVGTHILYIGKLIEADVFKEGEAMSYGYYQEHKDELMSVTTERGKTAWVCSMCGYVYYAEVLPDDFKCPKCGVGKDYFEKK